MAAELRRCWWCGHAAVVDTSRPEDNGLIRDDSRMDGGESWICTKPCERPFPPATGIVLYRARGNQVPLAP